MDFTIGIILLLTFFMLAFYCIKGYNLMIGFLVMAVIWTILPLAGSLSTGESIITILDKIFQSAPESWGFALVNICWGTWFGRVLIETGIASSLIRKTIELSGDKISLTIFLLNLVTAIIFSSMTGAGSVIAIGVIILPIFLSLGIPKAAAIFSFMGSVSAGIYLNPINFAQHRIFFLEPSQLEKFNFSWYVIHFGIIASIIMLVITSLLAIFYTRINRKWAAVINAQSGNKDVPIYALILPLMPVVLNLAFNFSVIGGFIISGFAALYICGKMSGNFRENCRLVNKLYYDSIVDTAPLIGFILTVPMFNAAAKYAAPYFNVIIGGIMPRTELVICIVFAACLFMGFFRGPMTLVGCGAATLGVLANIANFPVPFLYGVFVIPSITVNVACCITQSSTAWGLAYTKTESRDFLKLSIPNAYITGILQYIAVYLLLTGLSEAWTV